MSLQQVNALTKFWQHSPPAYIQLRRIGQFLGLETPKPPAELTQESPEIDQKAIHNIQSAGLGAFEGKPNDPMLDFLDVEFKVDKNGE